MKTDAKNAQGTPGLKRSRTDDAGTELVPSSACTARPARARAYRFAPPGTIPYAPRPRRTWRWRRGRGREWGGSIWAPDGLRNGEEVVRVHGSLGGLEARVVVTVVRRPPVHLRNHHDLDNTAPFRTLYSAYFR